MSKDDENRPLVAGSIGTFGKYFGKREEAKLNNCNNYKKTSVEEMAEFHRQRFEIMCDKTECDILAIETMRSIREA